MVVKAAIVAPRTMELLFGRVKNATAALMTLTAKKVTVEAAAMKVFAL